MGLSQADAARRLVSRSVVQRLWDQYQSEDSVSRRPVPGRPRATTPKTVFLTKEKNHYCRCRPLSSIRKKNLRYYGAKSSSQCRASTDLEGNSALDFNPTLLKDTVIEVVESWFGQGSRSVATLTCMCSMETVTGLRYRDETLDPYVRPFAAAIGNDFILMDDNLDC
ncbi:uncharacterized protein TNCV_1548181 [Trichonephila clavipes]|nr:uncharacterized protein TNCV_1548181 [Trichonephila clavipes]